MGLYTLGPILGPVIGPIAGGFISEYSTWRWVFWSTSITAVAVQVVGFLWLKESHPATLLKWKRERLVKETGNTKLYTEESAKAESLPVKIGYALLRPLRMFTTQPIVFCISIYMAYLFGVTYRMYIATISLKPLLSTSVLTSTSQSCLPPFQLSGQRCTERATASEG